MSELFPIEEEICQKLSVSAKELISRNSKTPEWTTKFKAILYKIAEKYGYQPWGTDAGDNQSEWLWDVCWAKLGSKGQGENDWKDLRGIFLACEIEWKSDLEYILEDFLKLTVAKAEYRLFVFACRKQVDADSMFDILQRHCPGSEGARYMAIVVPDGWKHEKDSLLPHCGWTL